MNVGHFLQDATNNLIAAGLETARLDVLVLLEDILGIDRALLLARPEQEISTTQAAKLKKLLKRRSVHEPLAYIRGHTEFYGRDFVITPAVLQPRPESETMIDLLGELSANGALTMKAPKLAKKPAYDLAIADVGAGSGALGITAKLEFPADLKIRLDLLEINPEALKIAKINVDKYTMDTRVIRSDLLVASSQMYDILLCNLPYVPDSHTVNPAALHEPKIAIFGGSDGLDLYRKLFKQVSRLPIQPLFILTEALPTQHSELQAIGARHEYQVTRSRDFIQVFKRV